MKWTQVKGSKKEQRNLFFVFTPNQPGQLYQGKKILQNSSSSKLVVTCVTHLPARQPQHTLTESHIHSRQCRQWQNQRKCCTAGCGNPCRCWQPQSSSWPIQTSEGLTERSLPPYLWPPARDTNTRAVKTKQKQNVTLACLQGKWTSGLYSYN